MSAPPARNPRAECDTHLRQMRAALRRLVAAARVGGPADEATHLGHALPLHAGELARASDRLLRLLGDLRAAAARADMERADAAVTQELRRCGAGRAARAAARRAPRGAAPPGAGPVALPS